MKTPSPLFKSEHLSDFEPWIMSLLVLVGLKQPTPSTVDLLAVAGMFSPIEDHHTKIADDLHLYAKYVDPKNPDPFLATITSGLSGLDGLDEFRIFYETKFDYLKESKIDDLHLAKCIYLGRSAKTSNSLDSLLTKLLNEENTLRKRTLKSYLRKLGETTDYPAEQIVAMLIAGGYAIKA